MSDIPQITIWEHEIIIERGLRLESQVLERADDGSLITGDLGFDHKKVMPFSQLDQTL